MLEETPPGSQFYTSYEISPESSRVIGLIDYPVRIIKWRIINLEELELSKFIMK